MPDDFCLKDSSVGILGLGLMGGSLALGLRGHCRALLGSDPDTATLEMACQRNVIDAGDRDAARILSQIDVVILAAPVPAILGLLEELPSLSPKGCIVMDLGSTKRSISEAMARLPERFDPIGGHPLCGKEKLSLANAEADLYREAPFLLTPLERTSSRALAAAYQISAAAGARAIVLNAEEHDRILAATSHLPFLVSSALAMTVPAEFWPFAGPGFKSASRLAGTPASMMLGVLSSNRDNVLNALHQLQAELVRLECALSSGDLSTLELKLNEAQSKHQRLVQ